MDALEIATFKAQSATCVHYDGAPLDFDVRSVTSKRFYYQCLLAHGRLIECGNGHFDSTRTQEYYRMLLSSKGPVPAALGNSEYKKRRLALSSSADHCIVHALLDKQPPEPKDR